MRANVLLPRTQQIQDDQPQQAILYTLLIPGAADGSQPDLLGQVQELVLAEFGGVTTLAQGNRRLHRGMWTAPSGAIYTDVVWPRQPKVAPVCCASRSSG